jgi:aminopeptidase N
VSSHTSVVAGVATALLASACSSQEPGLSASNHTQYVDTDIVHMALDVSLADQDATAVLTVAQQGASRVAFEAVGLEVAEVTAAGEPVAFEKDEAGLLWVEYSAEEISVRYHFEEQNNGNGWLTSGSTLVWPYHCGNLFPCNSDPRDGATFELAVHNAPDKLVFADSVTTESPTYVLAWAMGDYTEHELGSTSHDTKISVWYLPGGEERATEGTKTLVSAFEYFESTLGDYAFGDHSGSVEAAWQGGAYGGMEHHPYSHVGSDSMGDANTHIHEAAHGWFGDGVRIACWEDFVLSEGTVSYLTARATGAVSGSEAEEDVWTKYKGRLQSAMYGSGMKVAWPEGCASVDILDDQLFSSVPYMKGAFFYRALEKRIGVEALMQALAAFYQENVGKAAHMSDLLDTIATSSGYDPRPCADAWLREERVPDSDVCQ